MNELVDKVCQGDRRSLARAMSRIDAGGRAEPELEARLRRSTGQVPWWGFTGPPGVGKSTLIDGLLVRLREQNRRIGVVAVDPTSARSRGALLGDRVRMMRHAVDPGVFIRSLATHRHEGGLSDATVHCARLLELAGYDPVLIETVGVGQNEVDVASVADLCIVVLGPGYGDDIQLIKAGLLEIADLVVVNKCDLPEAHRLLKEVRAELAGTASVRQDCSEDTSDDSAGVPVVGIEAKSGRGLEELLQQLLALDRARRTEADRTERGQRRARGEIRRRVESACGKTLRRVLAGSDADRWIAELDQGNCSLDTVVSRLAQAALTEMQRAASDEGETI